jgi:hypothetical protein
MVCGTAVIMAPEIVTNAIIATLLLRIGNWGYVQSMSQDAWRLSLGAMHTGRLEVSPGDPSPDFLTGQKRRRKPPVRIGQERVSSAKFEGSIRNWVAIAGAGTSGSSTGRVPLTSQLAIV